MITLDGTLGITSPGGDSNASLTSSGNDTAAAFIPTGSSAPTNGLYLPAANTPAISSNSTKVLSVIKGSSLALEGATPQVGTGISFPATQVASSDVNTLDDYEEGTWTPTIVGTTTAGTGTYTTQIGTYTKVGRAVHFTLTLAWSAHTGTGNMYISGLPFTTNVSGYYSFAISSYNLTFTNQLSCIASSSSSNISPVSIVSNGAYALLAMDTSVTELEISGTYFV